MCSSYISNHLCPPVTLFCMLVSPPQFAGVKFKLVKSNSCSSRLELAGTGKTPPDLLRPNGRMRGRHILPEESSTRGTVEATIEEPEESVRDMVSRLESGNGATLITGRTTANKPRIIIVMQSAPRRHCRMQKTSC